MNKKRVSDELELKVPLTMAEANTCYSAKHVGSDHGSSDANLSKEICNQAGVPMTACDKVLESIRDNDESEFSKLLSEQTDYIKDNCLVRDEDDNIFFQAIKAGRTSMVRQLVNRITITEIFFGEEQSQQIQTIRDSCLLQLANDGNCDVLKVLLEADNRAVVVAKVRLTCAHVAALNGHTEMIRLLASDGVRLKVEREGRLSELFTACIGNNQETVRVLLETADISDAASCLQQLIKQNFTERVSTLLDCMPSPSLGETIHHVISQRNEQSVQGNAQSLNIMPVILDYIAKRCPDERSSITEYADKSGYTPLLATAREGQWTLMNLLLERGADFTKAAYGMTVFHLVIMNDRKMRDTDVREFMRIMLLRGADLNDLMHCVMEKAPGKIRDIAIEALERNLPQQDMMEVLAMRNKNGDTVMHLLAEQDHYDAFTWLVKYADLKLVNSKRQTVLHCAICNENVQIVTAIIIMAAINAVQSCHDSGSDHFQPARKGWQSLTGLLGRQDQSGCSAFNSITNASRTHQIILTTRRIFQCWDKERDIWAQQIMKSVMPETPLPDNLNKKPWWLINAFEDGAWGDTILHIAAREENLAAIEALLIFVGIDEFSKMMMMQNNRFRNPFHLAIETGNYSFAKSVLQYINITTKYDKDLAENKTKKNNTEPKRKSVRLHNYSEQLLIDLLDLRDDIIAIYDIRPLQWVACRKDNTVLGKLLEICTSNEENKIKINATDDDGYTAAMYCIIAGNIDGLEMLVKHGAEIFQLDFNGQRNVFHFVIEEYYDRPQVQNDIMDSYRHLKTDYIFKQQVVKPAKCSLKSRDLDQDDDERLGPDDQWMTPLQLAAAAGADEIFSDLLTVWSIFRDTRHNRIYYNMERIIPSQLIPSQLIPNTGETCDKSPRKDIIPPTKKTCEKSIIELIAEYCTIDDLPTMLEAESIHVVLRDYSRWRSGIFIVMFAIHVLYMSLFTAFNLATAEAKQPPNSSDIVWNDAKASYGWFLVYPAFLFVFEIMCLFKFCKLPRADVPRKTLKSFKYAILKSFKAILDGECDKKSILRYYKFFGYARHAFTASFIIILILWYSFYSTITDIESFNRYKVVLSVSLVHGWLCTLEFLNGFSDIHAFFVILKVVVIKDIYNIIFIYAFVLLGFVFAIYVYILSEPSLMDYQLSLINSVYQVFASMLGAGSLFDISTNEESTYLVISPHLLRLLLGAYICISTIILLNILIGMMTKTYENIVDLRETLWRIDAMHDIVWLAQDNIFGMRTLARKLIFRHILMHGLGRDEDTKSISHVKRPCIVKSGDECSKIRKVEVTLTDLQLEMKEINDKFEELYKHLNISSTTESGNSSSSFSTERDNSSSSSYSTVSDNSSSSYSTVSDNSSSSSSSSSIN